MRTTLLAILGTSLFATAMISAAPRPNIILCMADDMGWGDPGYNSNTVTYANGTAHPDQGWIGTPNMDTMAASGLRFNRFYAASAVCSPTRGSCLTGRNPFRLGVTTANVGRLEFDETPLSEVLSAQGYRCGHFGKWHLGSLTTLRSDSNRGGNASVYSAPWHHAYDTCFVTESKVPTYHPYRKASNSAALPTSFTDPNFYGTRYWRMPATWNQTSGEGDAVPVNEINNLADGDDSKLIVDQAIPFMQDAVSQGKPFFIVLWFHTPHKPVVDPDGISGVDSSDALKDSIEDLDLAIGRIRNELTSLGVRSNTMFWLTSDNGPEDGDNSPNETDTVRSVRSGRFLKRKRSLNDGGVRVPGILEWPDVITAPATTDFPSVTSDYYATILDYLCLSVPGQKPLDGISLRPVINGTATTRSKPIGFKFGSENSWVAQQYKLINTGSGWMLYDMLNIAAGQEVEQTPVATAANIGSQPQAIQDVYNTMMAEFNAWNASVGSDTPYVHASQPTATLSTPATLVAEPFTVTATFSEAVSQLNAWEFAVTNGTASDLTGGGTTWEITVTPGTTGAVIVNLPEGCVIDPDGNLNAASNQLITTYANPTAPDVSLSTPANPVNSSFVVTTTFTDNVSGLSATDFDVTNGTAANLNGGPAIYTVTVTPETPGITSIFLPGGVAQDDDTNGNNASNTLDVTFVPVDGTTIDTVFAVSEGQTVDSSENVPGDEGNNLSKFTAGNTNDGVTVPYTSALYVRSSTSDALRRVRAFTRFDLSALAGLPVASATLTFNAHSLNDQEALGIQLMALGADWAESGAPLPNFNHATVGSMIDGGSIITGLDSGDHTKDYSFDLTATVRNWLDGTWPNHGVQLQLTNTSVNNGVGIMPSGTGAIELLIEQAPLFITALGRGPNPEDVTIVWNSAPGETYRVEANADLQGVWDPVEEVSGAAGGRTSYTHVDGMNGFTTRFYRIVFPTN